jgi:hypothetical protein
MKTSEIVRLYLAGSSSNAVAARAGVSARTVRRRLQAAGVQLRPRRLPRPLCEHCEKRPVTQLRGKYCAECWPLLPAPASRRCALVICRKVFQPPRDCRDQRFCCTAHWYASPECAATATANLPSNPPRKRLNDLVNDGTFRAYRGEQLLQEKDLDEAHPEVLRELQRLFREATSRTERRALAQCFARIVRARRLATVAKPIGRST